MEFKRFESENPVWGYFLRSKSGERAECETCKTTISCKGGSTGAMRNHLFLKQDSSRYKKDKTASFLGKHRQKFRVY